VKKEFNFFTNLVIPPIMSWIDYPDNKNPALVWYFYGCEHYCFNCQNETLQRTSIKEDKISLDEFISLSIDYAKKYKTNKIVLQGGDPLYKNNIFFIKKFLEINKQTNMFDVCIYTGYDKSFVKENNIKYFSFLKTGKYIEELKQISEKTNDYISFASKNQKLYNKNCKLLSEEGKYYWRDDYV
jgi:organic radical activating enzyme